MSDTDAVSVARLISLVKERPVLWDRQEEVYKNRKLTRQAWTEICEALIDNYHDLGENEKLAIGRSIIGKWANLRDNWLRYWRKRQELLRVGSSTKSLKKYIHHDQLLFLSKVYDPDGQQEVEEIQVEVDVISDPEFESTIEFDETSQNSWNIPQYLHVSTTPPPQDPSERHLYFFHSIMPMICDFDNDQTLEFQSGVLDWVKRVKRREYVNVENCQCPSSQGIQEQIVCGKGFYKMRSSITCTPKLCHCNSTSKFAVKQEQKNCFFHPLDNSGFSESTSASNNSGGDTNFIEKEFKPNITINEQEFFSLKNIVTKLEKISETIESRVCDNGHDHLEKNFGSLLTQLPPKKIQSLKRKIVKECVREGFKKIQIGSIECFHTDRSNEPLELVQNASSVSEAPAIQSDNAKGLCSPVNKEPSPSILRDTLQNLSVAPK